MQITGLTIGRKDFAVLLKIRHPNIDPAVLTEAFGLEPECCWQAGEANRDSDEPGAVRRESYWVAEVPSQPPARVYLGSTLMTAAWRLDQRKEFWARLQSEGASAQLIVVLGEDALSGFELPHLLLAMISRNGLSVSFDLRDAAEAAA